MFLKNLFFFRPRNLVYQKNKTKTHTHTHTHTNKQTKKHCLSNSINLPFRIEKTGLTRCSITTWLKDLVSEFYSKNNSQLDATQNIFTFICQNLRSLL